MHPSRLCNDLSLLRILDRDLPIHVQRKALKIRPFVDQVSSNIKLSSDFVKQCIFF